MLIVDQNRTSRILLPSGGRGRRGFTLVELLVVMAISVILLGLIFGPIISSFNFVTRAEQTADAQETARRVLQQVQRETKDAVAVGVSAGDILHLPQWERDSLITDFPPLQRSKGVRNLGYINAYDENGVARQLSGALLDVVPPDDTMGYHGGRLTNPPVPQMVVGEHDHEKGNGGTQAVNPAQPHNVIVRFFVGLADPGYPHTDPNDRFSARATSTPQWANANVQNDILGGAAADNAYVLYRIEFDPDDPAYGNWAIPDPNYKGNPRSGQPVPLVVNPDFFYDGRSSPTGDPYWETWRRNAVAITPLDNIDLVRFTRDNNNNVTAAQSTVTFTPTVLRNDAATPVFSASGAPVSYTASHGNWTGVQNNGGLTTFDFNPPALGVYPHIVVYEPETVNNASDLNVVYDNWETNTASPAYPGRSRSLTWNSRLGTVSFVTGGLATTGEPQLIRFDYPLTGNDNGWEFDLLKMARQRNALGTIPPNLEKYIHIIPDRTQLTLTYRRQDLNGSGALVDDRTTFTYKQEWNPIDVETPRWWKTQVKDPPPQLPEPGTYYLTPDEGHVILGFALRATDKVYPIPNSQATDTNGQVIFEQPVLHVQFAFQTNTANDIVKLDYGTRSLLNTNLGIRMFDPSTSRPILVQLNDKIAMRNMGR